MEKQPDHQQNEHSPVQPPAPRSIHPDTWWSTLAISLVWHGRRVRNTLEIMMKSKKTIAAMTIILILGMTCLLLPLSPIRLQVDGWQLEVIRLVESTPTSTFVPIPTSMSIIEEGHIEATFTPFSSRTATRIYLSTPVPCTATTDTEYVISGGPNPTDPIFVDDILRIFINANLTAEIGQGGRNSPAVSSIHFVADTADVLRVQAQDANNCYSLEALWLQKADGSCLVQLSKDIRGPNCGSEPPEQIFFDQTFSLP